jgi:hypothetical protein
MSEDMSPKKGWSMRYGDSKQKVDQKEREKIADALKNFFAEDREEALKELESRMHRKQKTP